MYNPYQMPQSYSAQIIRVNGENGARAYQMAPNSSALLLDETAPLVWLKQTDGAGYPSLTPYKIEPYQPEPQPDYQGLADRIQRLEEMIQHVQSNFDQPQTAQSGGQYKSSNKR